MNLVENWQHKWFGMWHEQGEGCENYPSINEFIRPEIVAKYRFKELTNYLENSQMVSVTSGDYSPDPYTGRIIKESISFVTDGEWLWLDNLPYFIQKYNVAIPVSFLKRIESNNYKPVKWSGDFDSLEWPC